MSKKKINISKADAGEELEKAMVELVFSEEFYANLLLNVHREFTTEIPTIGVAPPGTKYSKDEIALIVNPYFFCSLDRKEQVDVLKHECLHVINNHFVRFRDLEPEIYDKDKKRNIRQRVEDAMNASVLNQVGDFAINEYLPNLPKKLKCFDKEGNMIVEPNEIPDPKNPDKTIKNPNAGKPVIGSPCLVKSLKKKYPKIKTLQNTEYYYEFLQQENDKNKQDQQSCQGQKGDNMVLDDHGLWHESDLDEDAITDKVKETVNKAVDQCKKGIGSLPSDVIDAIEKLNYVPKDWRHDLQNFVARQIIVKIESTRKKRNRRYGILYPGIKKNPVMHLVVAIDSSGSVSQEELTQFYAEIKRIHNLGVHITVIECDARVNQVYTFDPKKPFNVKGRGGTAFGPVFEYIKKEKIQVDGLIYLTDGGTWESPEELTKPKFPVMWAVLKNYSKNFNWPWGRKTEIEVKRKVRR